MEMNWNQLDKFIDAQGLKIQGKGMIGFCKENYWYGVHNVIQIERVHYFVLYCIFINKCSTKIFLGVHFYFPTLYPCVHMWLSRIMQYLFSLMTSLRYVNKNIFFNVNKYLVILVYTLLSAFAYRFSQDFND